VLHHLLAHIVVYQAFHALDVAGARLLAALHATGEALQYAFNYGRMVAKDMPARLRRAGYSVRTTVAGVLRIPTGNGAAPLSVNFFGTLGDLYAPQDLSANNCVRMLGHAATLNHLLVADIPWPFRPCASWARWMVSGSGTIVSVLGLCVMDDALYALVKWTGMGVAAHCISLEPARRLDPSVLLTVVRENSAARAVLVEFAASHHEWAAFLLLANTPRAGPVADIVLPHNMGLDEWLAINVPGFFEHAPCFVPLPFLNATPGA
jgi:hypothetical protein